MDRLPIVAAGLVLAVAGASSACEKGGDSEHKQSSASRSRVQSVAAETSAKDVEAFCDVRFAGDRAPVYKSPPMTDGAGDDSAGSWRWVNLWATWCKPCVEEFPLLQKWQGELRSGGVEVSLELISVDDNDEVVDAFRREHPDVPPSRRLSSSDDLEPWLGSLGVSGATVPIHVLVDPKGAVRCVRASGVSAGDAAVVRVLFGA